MKKYFLIVAMLLCSLFTGVAQTVSVSGTVTDSQDGTPVVGATVMAENISGKIIAGVSTDNNGKYKINASQDAVLVFSIIGYETIKVPVKGRKNIDVTLKYASETMDAVVVTALGVTREAKSLNYSRQAVNA